MTTKPCPDNNYGWWVRTRREALGLKWREVAAIAGVAPATIHRANKNGGETLQPSTRRNVERALEWEPCSIDAILAGGEPTPVGTTAEPEQTALADPVDRVMAMTRAEMLDEALQVDRLGTPAGDEWLHSLLRLRMHARRVSGWENHLDGLLAQLSDTEAVAAAGRHTEDVERAD